MGIEPPYMYQKPSQCTFVAPTDKLYNAKSVTQASWAPQPPQPKLDRGLINSKEMNRHPDSYFIVPYGNLNWKPMCPKTKAEVKWTRLAQLFLRICALLGAVGLLVCVICIKPLGTSLDWIIRVPPGIAILHTVYAIYHLSRSSKGRTPASSASYMIFASIVDASLLPFLAFTALMARTQYVDPSASSGQWETLFATPTQTHIVIYSAFLISVTTGSIHMASLCISIYLALIFRKISKLPPDMNPLEDNLTSRHKRNKSSLSATVSDVASHRDSRLSAPLMDAQRAVPFMHTRNESASNLSATQRRPAMNNRDSRTDLPSSLYEQENASQRSSRTDLRRSPDRPSPRRAPGLASSRVSYPSRPISAHQTTNAYYEEDAPSSENWVSHPSPSSSPSNGGDERRHLQAEEGFNDGERPIIRASPALSHKYDFSNRSPRPLSMNPPTPSSATFAYEPLPQSSTPERQRRPALQPAAGNSNGNGNADSSPATWEEKNFVRQKVRRYEGSDASSNGSGKWLGGGKSRFYGSLRSSIGRRGGRAVSSGMDDGQGGAGTAIRGRDVSGKVAEEGRGGRLE